MGLLGASATVAYKGKPWYSMSPMTKPPSAPPLLRQPEWLREFGRRLRTARIRAGLSQQQLAAPDLTKGFVSLLESARSYPSVETAVALAQRTHTSLAALLLDPAGLRLDVARSLLDLARTMDPARRGADVLQLVGSAEILVPDMPAEMRVRAMLVRSRVAMAADRLGDAARLADEAVALARRQDLAGALGAALTVRGTIDGRRGEFSAAAATLEQALDVMRRGRSVDSEDGVRAFLSLAAARLQTDQIEAAQSAYQQALEIATAVGLPMLRGRALTGLGMVEWKQQQLDRAVDFFSQAHAVFRETEDLAETGRVLNNLGLVRRAQGLYDEALSVLTAALRIRERDGDLRGRSATLDELAHVFLELGRLDEAADAARQAIEDANTAGDQAREAVAQATLARVLRAQNDRVEAADLLRGAVATLTRLGMTQEAAAAAGDLGLLLNDAGEHTEAADYLARALTLTMSRAARSSDKTRTPLDGS